MFSPQEHSARLNGIFFARFGGWSSFKGVVFQQLWVPIRVFIRAPLQCSSWSWSALSPAAREAIEAPEMGVAWDYSAFIVHIATAFLVTAVVSAFRAKSVCCSARCSFALASAQLAARASEVFTTCSGGTGLLGQG